MITDSNIHLLPLSTHIPSDGSDIGGVDPATYGYQIVPGKNRSLLLWTGGNTTVATDTTSQGYPAWMAYPTSPRQVLGLTNLSLKFRFAFGGSLAGFSSIETDTLIVTGGYKYNLSGQLLQGVGFQIANHAGEWVLAGINTAVVEPGIDYEVEYQYAFDFNHHSFSVTNIVLSGTSYDIPSALQGVLAASSTWAPGTYLQIQLGSLPAAEAWQIKIEDMNWIWTA